MTIRKKRRQRNNRITCLTQEHGGIQRANCRMLSLMRKGMETYHNPNMGNVTQFNANTLEKLKTLRYGTVNIRKMVLSGLYRVFICILYHSICVFHTIGEFRFL